VGVVGDCMGGELKPKLKLSDIKFTGALENRFVDFGKVDIKSVMESVRKKLEEAGHDVCDIKIDPGDPGKIIVNVKQQEPIVSAHWSFTFDDEKVNENEQRKIIAIEIAELGKK